MVSLYAFDPFNEFHFLLSLEDHGFEVHLSYVCTMMMTTSPKRAQVPLSRCLVKHDWDKWELSPIHTKAPFFINLIHFYYVHTLLLGVILIDFYPKNKQLQIYQNKKRIVRGIIWEISNLWEIILYLSRKWFWSIPNYKAPLYCCQLIVVILAQVTFRAQVCIFFIIWLRPCTSPLLCPRRAKLND